MIKLNETADWINKLRTAAARDPRKTGVLAVLFAVLAAMLGRALLGGSGGPARAVGNPAARLADSTVVTSANNRSRNAGDPEFTRANNTVQRLRDWLNEPIKPLTRNLFTVKLDYFPADGGRPAQALKTAADGEFWGRLEKSLMLQADQRDKRENLLANYQAEAAKLRLDSIMWGTQPKAMIEGKLVAEGDVVASFRVLKIEPRRIVVEREGIRLEILMK